MIHLGEGSHGLYVGNLDEVVCSQLQSKPQIGEDAVVLVHGEALEVVLQKLESPLRRDEARMQLVSLQRAFHMGQ
jgi:hypothetical protein